MAVTERIPMNQDPGNWHHRAYYREAHPLPFVITHWINLVSFIVLIITGFYIHYPAFGDFMGVARGAHILFGIILTINCIVRIFLAFIIKSAPAGGTRKVDSDFKNYLPSKMNRHQLGAWIKYYLFAKKDHPLGAKYGVPQKLSYLLVPILILIMAGTGFALWAPTADWALCQFTLKLVGGAMNMRIIHYLLMWVFICFILIHAYLASIEGGAALKMIFFWKESPGLVYDPDTGMVVGFDDMDVDDEHVRMGRREYEALADKVEKAAQKAAEEAAAAAEEEAL